MELRDWLADIKRSRCKPTVEHDPMTPRYFKAANDLYRILANSTPIGWQKLPAVIEKTESNENIEIDPYEVVFWTPPVTSGEKGIYWAMQIDYEGDDVVDATIFCYYDGNDQSPSLYTEDGARIYMQEKYPEYEVIND